MARRGDLGACVFKGAVLKYCHKANAETERVPRGQSIESGGHGLKAAAEKSRAKCIRERMRWAKVSRIRVRHVTPFE